MSDRDALLDRLLAESDIRNAIASLAQATDSGTPEEYVEHWTSDAVWEVVGRETRSGRDDILAGAQARHEAGLIGPAAQICHIVATSVINVDGERATARSSHAVVVKNPEAVIGFYGTYDDEFRRESGTWLLAKRTVRPH
jgi:ketosteroid isomerase-like protein